MTTTTTTSVYAAAPFWGWVFGDWLNAPRGPIKYKFWRVVDSGFKTQFSRAVFTVLSFALVVVLGYTIPCESDDAPCDRH